MQVIDKLSINDREYVNVYGTIENPLFRCSDILISVLKYGECNENWFYKNNKTEPKYIDSLLLQQGMKRELFFTEFGLYRCLFTSQKPVAIDFQERVALLLKDLRIGNLKLQQQRESDFMKLADQHNNLLSSLMNLQQKEQEQTRQIEHLSNMLQSAYQNVVIYKIIVEEDGMLYVGKSTDVITREQAHKTRSSNQAIRLAVEQGKTIRIVILAEVKCLTVSQTKYLERQHILAIPAAKRLNAQLPEVLDEHNLAQEFKDIVKYTIDNPLNIPIDQWRSRIVQEDESKEEIKDDVQVTPSNMYLNVSASEYIDYINANVDSKFKASIDEIQDFYTKNTFYPRDSSNVSGDEKRMARLCVKIRTQHCNQGVGDGKHYTLTVERYSYIIHKMPNFFTSYDQEANFRAKVDKIASFYISHDNKLPSATSEDQEEVKLNDFLNKIRTAFNNDKLSVQRESYCRMTLPFGTFNDEILLNEAKFRSNIKLLKQWFDSHNNQFPSPIQNKKLTNFIKTLKSAIAQPDKQSFKLDASRMQFIKDNFQSLDLMLKQ